MVDLAEWTAHKLIGPRVSKNINLVIHIIPPKMYKTDGIYGLTEIADGDDRASPRNFTISMTSKFGILRSLRILAHEMVHVKQHARGELKYCGRTGFLRWTGSNVLDDGSIEYWDLPWEIEAHGREKGLVYQWAIAKKHDNASWFQNIF